MDSHLSETQVLNGLLPASMQDNIINPVVLQPDTSLDDVPLDIYFDVSNVYGKMKQNADSYIRLIEDGQLLNRRIAFGSKILIDLCEWEKLFSKLGYLTRCELRPEDQLESMVDDCLAAQIYRTILRTINKVEKVRIVVVTGDGNQKNKTGVCIYDSILQALQAGINVTLWGWNGVTSNNYVNLQKRYPSLFKLRYLDELVPLIKPDKAIEKSITMEKMIEKPKDDVPKKNDFRSLYHMQILTKDRSNFPVASREENTRLITPLFGRNWCVSVSKSVKTSPYMVFAYFQYGEALDKAIESAEKDPFIILNGKKTELEFKKCSAPGTRFLVQSGFSQDNTSSQINDNTSSQINNNTSSQIVESSEVLVDSLSTAIVDTSINSEVYSSQAIDDSSAQVVDDSSAQVVDDSSSIFDGLNPESRPFELKNPFCVTHSTEDFQRFSPAASAVSESLSAASSVGLLETPVLTRPTPILNQQKQIYSISDDPKFDVKKQKPIYSVLDEPKFDVKKQKPIYSISDDPKFDANQQKPIYSILITGNNCVLPKLDQRSMKFVFTKSFNGEIPICWASASLGNTIFDKVYCNFPTEEIAKTAIILLLKKQQIEINGTIYPIIVGKKPHKFQQNFSTPRLD